MDDGNATSYDGTDDGFSDPTAGQIAAWSPDSWHEQAAYGEWPQPAEPQIVEARPVWQPDYLPDWPALRAARFQVGQVSYTTQRADASHPLSVYANRRYRSTAGNVVVTLRVTLLVIGVATVGSMAAVVIVAMSKLLAAM